jgi:hypothetical protein
LNSLQRFEFERGRGPRNRDLPDPLDLWNSPVERRNQLAQLANGLRPAGRYCLPRRHRGHRGAAG